jgi:SAM-dependent methyltransferase
MKITPDCTDFLGRTSQSDVSFKREVSIQDCVACDRPDLTTFYSARRQPVCIGTLWPTRQQAVNCRKGDITLALCENCGTIFNTAFDPDLIDYNQPYDNALDYSEVFRDYSRSLARRLIDRHNLYCKRIVEIGCGNGQFLGLLCRLGGNSGVGYDPSHKPSADAAIRPSSVRIVPHAYTKQYAETPVDFICCRQVLEHIPSPRSFLTSLRQTAGMKCHTGVYFEVPNVMHTLSGVSIWTIIYEHCVYYCAAALSRLFRASGFEVHEVTEEYDGQFLGIEAYPRSNGTHEPIQDSILRHEIAERAAAFQAQLDEQRRRLHNSLLGVRVQGATAVVWGAGARAVSLLNTLEDAALVQYAVDINPNKHGKFIAGTGHEILAPERLGDVNPAVVIVMNQIYTQEISKALQALGLSCELIVA